jgi:hypothetical protein
MHAEERTIDAVLTEQLRYEIPPYQRPYSWEPEHTRDLLDDVAEAFEASDSEYFIGSIITIEKEPRALYEVVDGQQRLTTLNLIFARLGAAVESDPLRINLVQRILPHDVFTGQSAKPRLTLRKRDRGFFRDHVLEGKPVSADVDTLDPPQARLLRNMATVDDFLSGRTQDWLRDFARYLLRNVYVVVVTTGNLDSAFRLFNVLNDRGLGLSNADLIKNSLFTRLHDDSRQEELEDLWVELEDTVGASDLDVFLGYHRTALNAEKSRKSLAEDFEEILSSSSGSATDLLKGLIRSAQNYQRIVMGDISDPRAQRPLAALKRVTYDEWVPALLAFMNAQVDGIEVGEFVSLLEKITMQNWVRRLGRTARNTIYYRLIGAIHARENSQRIREIVTDSANNEEFFSFLAGNVYGLPSARAVLLRLEEGDRDDSVTKMYAGTITIEHVLPQSAKDEYWTERFTDSQRSEWVHRLGNLTLLSGMKNSAASNSAFPRKKDLYLKRNQKVSFDLTKDVCKESDWTLPIVVERQNRLMEIADRLWRIE